VRDQPEQHAPPVQRLRLRYAKRGRMRFTSHRDFSRAFERALVRAGVPMAYSSGFSPHPRISYAGAAPTGSASEAEYLEIGLAQEVDPAQLAEALDRSLPDGLDVLEAVPSGGGALADRLEASWWQITVPLAGPETGPETGPGTEPGTGPAVDADALRGAVDTLLATDEVLVERMTKKGLRSFDARAAIVRLSLADMTGSAPTCAILNLVLRHGTPSVRPDDVLAALRETSGLSLAAALQQRLAQGPLDEGSGTVGDPLAPDRDAAG
jgi:radical SAM-linked protein